MRIVRIYPESGIGRERLVIVKVADCVSIQKPGTSP